MRIFSGMQPSGRPHLGNYLGAMKQHIELEKNNECIYFIANLHSLTTIKNRELLSNLTIDLAMDYLALGLNTEKTIFFKQSDISEHAELAWIFDCITNMGLLERAHAWKDAKAKKNKEESVGLFNYPVLMAADILLYDPDFVPVGKDQKQHVEIARDIAMKFNQSFGNYFKIPEPMIKEEVETIIGTDGSQKMSKSYGNIIEIFADEEILKKQVMGIKTDSAPIDKPKNPDKCNVFRLYKYFAEDNEIKKIREQYSHPGFGYGEAKKILLEKLLDYFSEYRKNRVKLSKNLDYVEEVLKNGAVKAKKIAIKRMDEIKKICGLK